VQDTATLPRPASVERPETEISFPAIILCDEETAALKVAGLPILDRLIVAAHRAGAAQVSVVSSKPLPLLPRTTALGISFQLVADMPNIEQPTLVLSTGLLVQAADLKAMVRNRGRLIGRDGVPLPAGVITGPLVRDLEEQLRHLPEVVAQGVAEPITGASSVSAASRALWGSLASPLDGVVDKYFNRPVGHIVSKQLVRTSVSPNQVSVAASLLGLLSAWLFAGGSHDAAVLGAIVFQLSAILDAVDGDLARVMFKESALGKWLDIVGDQVVHVAVFVAIGVGLYRAGSAAPVIPLAASAGVGVVISLIVVVRGLKQLESRSNPRSQRLIESTANRDFSVLLIVLALLDKLDWFLWMSAVGVHIFWIAALVVQKTGLPRTDKTECAP
jgi:phosphatidylglycerophosphate synthase